MHLADLSQRRSRQNGKLELHVAGALQHVDGDCGTAVNFEDCGLGLIHAAMLPG